eukprot:4829508-Pyramimonas_sp.AAC.1
MLSHLPVVVPGHLLDRLQPLHQEVAQVIQLSSEKCVEARADDPHRAHISHPHLALRVVTMPDARDVLHHCRCQFAQALLGVRPTT